MHTQDTSNGLFCSARSRVSPHTVNTKNGFKQSADWSVKIEFLENLIEPLGANTSNGDSLQARAFGLARIHLDSSCGGLNVSIFASFFYSPCRVQEFTRFNIHDHQLSRVILLGVGNTTHSNQTIFRNSPFQLMGEHYSKLRRR